MSTRAIAYLKKQHIPFEVAEYDHQEKGAGFAARAIGFPLERTIKTLVADLHPAGHVMVLMPGDRQLSLKKLANVCGVKRAAMADTLTAQRLTGYLVGGISPFGTKKKLPVVMEASLLRHTLVAINGGQRGVMLLLAPKDIIAAVKARTGDLYE